jgi:hypothetical protein
MDGVVPRSMPRSTLGRTVSNSVALSVVLLAVHALTACGGSRTSSESSGGTGGSAASTLCMPKNGARLRAVELRGDDGARYRSDTIPRWYDTELGVQCEFGYAQGTKHWCLPVERVAQENSYMLEYLDFTCTRPVARHRRSPCDPVGSPAYTLVIERGSGDACEEPVMRMFSLGARIAQPAMTYYQDAGGCVPGNAVPDDLGGLEFYEIAEELPPERFVSADLDAQGGRLTQGTLAGSDGCQDMWWWPLFDREANTECYPAAAADGTERCLPSGEIGRRGFADSACTQPLYPVPLQECEDSSTPMTLYDRQLEMQECPLEPRIRVYEVGTEAGIPDPIYVAPDCTASPNPERTVYYPIGREISPGAFARFEPTQADCGPGMASGTRLKALVRVAEGARVPSGFMDSEFGNACSVALASDGALRCLPGGAALPPAYSDAACTRPAAAVSTCVSGDYVRVGVPLSSDAPCAGARFRVHALGDPTGELYTKAFDGTCTPATIDPGSTARELGPEIPPERFVAFTETH